jgi:hypothetical protein
MNARSLLLASVVALAAGAHAQAQTPGDSTRAAQDSALRVFLDCPDSYCDFDYYRTEITFVNWVRDRQFAQLHLLITTQGTGGGREYTLTFIGLERFASVADTLRWLSRTTDTDDDIRRGLARTMRLGLVRFAARTPVAPRIEISYSAPAQTAAQVKDRWNYWVFTAGVSSNYSAEQVQNFFFVSTSLSANRTTEAWKIRLSANGGYSESNFHYRPDSLTSITYRNLQRNYGGSASVARSLGPHWSAGLRGSASQATFSNQDLALRVAPVVEFDVFPYSQSTRRLLSVQYAAGLAAFNYADTTIYNQTAETLLNQTLTVSLDVKEPWGSTGVSLEGATFFNNFAKHHVALFGNADVRIFKGLSLFFFGSAARVKDRISVARTAGATPAAVLLQRRQQETDFSYSAYVQLRYTFGSKFANIVNPRLREESGGSVFFSF